MARALVTLTAIAAAYAQRRNVALIILDDLRPELPGVYGCSHVSAPAIAKLASESVTFRRAYAQEALCAPSRNSFLSGRRPDETRAWQFLDDFREVGPDWTSLPEAFKKANYTTVGAGKVFHPGLPASWDMPRSWDDRMNNSKWMPWLYPSEPKCPNSTSWCAIEDGNTTSFEDTQTLERILELLEYNVTSPYFVAAGFRKPHLQWRFPAQFLPAAEPNVSQIPIAPIGAPGLSFHMPLSELSPLADFQACGGADVMSPTFAYPDTCQRTWRRAYYASVAFVDSMVGAILDRLDQSDIVVLLGDHGFHLGDLAEWEKFTNFENSVRVPLMVRADGILEATVRDDLVELVDLYPTLAALAGIDIAYTSAESVPLAGRNLFSGRPTVAARSQFPRCVGGEEYHENFTRNTSYTDWYLNDCNDVPSRLFTHMGYSIRTTEWRFTAWFQWNVSRPHQEPVALELYDHRLDDGTCNPPSAFDGPFETRNLASDPDMRSVVESLFEILINLFHIRTPSHA